MAVHCDDGVSASLNAYGWWSCWLAREVWGGVVHLIDTCDIPCDFFVDASLVGLLKTLKTRTLIGHACLQAELMFGHRISL